MEIMRGDSKLIREGYDEIFFLYPKPKDGVQTGVALSYNPEKIKKDGVPYETINIKVAGFRPSQISPEKTIMNFEIDEPAKPPRSKLNTADNTVKKTSR